jgi:hypothetical protein
MGTVTVVLSAAAAGLALTGLLTTLSGPAPAVARTVSAAGAHVGGTPHASVSRTTSGGSSALTTATMATSNTGAATTTSLAKGKGVTALGGPTNPPGSPGASSGNLLVGDQATFSGTTGGWVGGAAQLQWAASPASTPNGSLAITSTGNAQPAAESGSPQTGGVTAANPGALYKGTATLQSAGTRLAVEPVVVFYGSGGQILTAVFGQQTQVAAGTWTTLVPVLGIAPATTAGVTFGVIVASSSPGQTVYLEFPVLTTAPPPGAPSVIGPLSTAGNKILQGNGSSLVADGINLPGLYTSAAAAGLSVNSILQIKAWGANTVRVPLNEDLWLATSCAYSPAYAAEVSQVVNWITTLGMVAVVELGFNNPADIGTAPGGSCPGAGPQIMADPASVTFWSQVATLFASNPLVAFDLYNEPHDISDQVWLNGGTVNGFPATGMQQMYDAVRSAGASNLVVASGNKWANTPPSTPITGSTIAYAAHVYTCPDAAPPNCSSTTPYDPSTILDNWVQFSSAMPVMVSEFGWANESDGTYNAAVVGFARSHGWGWLAFAWTTTAPWGLLATTPVSGPDQPAPSGMPVLAALGGMPWP